MVKRRCRLCFRKFVSRRVLVEHMRAHMLDQSVSHFLPSGDSEHGIATRDHYEFLVAEPTASSSVVTPRHRESVMELAGKKNHRTRKPRSKRILHTPASSTSVDYRYFGPQQRQHYVRGWGKSSAVDVEANLSISSTTEVTTEADLAFCLMMMSRDKWNSSVGERSTITSKNKMKYRCGTCNKGFRSYQALGGHRASHKKNRVYDFEQRVSNSKEDENRADDGSDSMTTKRVYECSICKRVFASGQALGGHRTSHLSVLNNGIIHKHNSCDNSKITNNTARQESLPKGIEGEAPSVRTVKSMMIKKVHECPICLRVFVSGQALGGHKRCHVLVSNNEVDHINNLFDNCKITNNTTCQESLSQDIEGKVVSVLTVKSTLVKKVYECPICGKVFASGQALGDHKRSHFLASKNETNHNNNLLDNSKITKNTTRRNSIDFKLPIYSGDEDELAVFDVQL